MIAYAADFDVDAFYERMKARAEQSTLFDKVKAGGPQKWNAIRRIYEIQNEVGGTSPYFVDWPSIFTPIENGAWQYIRSYGIIPMFPQYPVGRVFVDFGDPEKRIAIECDGAQWHDKKKDSIRDRKLNDLGWTVYRFTGRELWKAEDDEGSARDKFRHIAEHHYGRMIWHTPEELDAMREAERA